MIMMMMILVLRIILVHFCIIGYDNKKEEGAGKSKQKINDSCFVSYCLAGDYQMLTNKTTFINPISRIC